MILKDPEKAGFYCPCHSAYFTADGAVISPETSKSPRAMDTLEYEIVRDGTAESGTWWLAVAWEKFEENTPEKNPV